MDALVQQEVVRVHRLRVAEVLRFLDDHSSGKPGECDLCGTTCLRESFAREAIAGAREAISGGQRG